MNKLKQLIGEFTGFWIPFWVAMFFAVVLAILLTVELKVDLPQYSVIIFFLPIYWVTYKLGKLGRKDEKAEPKPEPQRRPEAGENE